MFRMVSSMSVLIMLIGVLTFQGCTQIEVSKEDFDRLATRVEQLEKDISDLKRQVATLEASPTESSSVTPSTVEQRFRITWPKSGETVATNPDGTIIVRGVGAVQGSKIEVSVKTDTWYRQDYNVAVNIDSDGSWTLSPCFLKGTGFYRTHHIIKATIKTPDGKLYSDVVENVAVQ
jgi:hypothetical protein